MIEVLTMGRTGVDGGGTLCRIGLDGPAATLELCAGAIAGPASPGLPAPPLGGDPGDTARRARTAWREALGLPGVRGLVVGRALRYPSDDGVAAAVDTGAAMLEVA
ncbi:hypothetical protein AB0B56_30520 [Streptosporangium canum]|uniref:Cgl0159 family (beta/alpha)8-fold protein n=1 Tax=Streptosporangium canum TaxID=324952 RepID=UPI0034126F0C